MSDTNPYLSLMTGENSTAVPPIKLPRRSGVDTFSTIERLGQAENLHPTRIKELRALAGQESTGNANAYRADSKASGGLQVIPSTGLRYVTPEEWATPEGKLKAGVRYFKHLDSLFPGENDTDRRFAAYHAGEGAVIDANRQGKRLPHTEDRYITRQTGVPYFTDTHYVPSVMRRFQSLNGKSGASSGTSSGDNRFMRMMTGDANGSPQSQLASQPTTNTKDAITEPGTDNSYFSLMKQTSATDEIAAEKMPYAPLVEPSPVTLNSPAPQVGQQPTDKPTPQSASPTPTPTRRFAIPVPQTSPTPTPTPTQGDDEVVRVNANPNDTRPLTPEEQRQAAEDLQRSPDNAQPIQLQDAVDKTPYRPGQDLSLPAQVATGAADLARNPPSEKLASMGNTVMQPVTVHLPIRRGANNQPVAPTTEEISNAYAEKLGKGYRDVFDRYRSETGREIATPHGLDENLRQVYVADPHDAAKGHFEWQIELAPRENELKVFHAYAEGGLKAAEREATRQQEERAATLKQQAADKEANKPGYLTQVSNDARLGLLKGAQGTAQAMENLRKIHAAEDPSIEDANQRAIRESQQSMPAYQTTPGAIVGEGLEQATAIARIEAMGGGVPGVLLNTYVEHLNEGTPEALKQAAKMLPMLAAGYGANRIAALQKMSPVARQAFVRTIVGGEAAVQARAEGQDAGKAALFGALLPAGKGKRYRAEEPLSIKPKANELASTLETVNATNAALIDSQNTATDTREIEHARLGRLRVAPDQTGVKPEYVRVIKPDGTETEIQHPRGQQGNREAAFVQRAPSTPDAPDATLNTTPDAQLETNNYHRMMTKADSPEVAPTLTGESALQRETEKPASSDALATRPDAETTKNQLAGSLESIDDPTNRQRELSDEANLVGERSGEAGAIDPDLLTLGVRPFVKQDVVPTVKSVAKSIDFVRQVFAPQTRGDTARRTAETMRDYASQTARDHDVAGAALDGARKLFAGHRDADNLDFFARIEGGAKQPTAAEQHIADTLDSVMGRATSSAKNISPSSPSADFYREYLPSLFKDGESAREVFNQMTRAGNRPTLAAGVRAGLEPVSHNPVDLALKIRTERDRFVASRRTVADLEAQGLAKVFTDSAKAPPDWTKIDDRATGRQGKRGSYYAPDGAAQIINNHLSPGLVGNPIFDAYRNTAGALVQAKLGLSAFHATFTSINSIMSKVALGAQELTSGRPLRAAKTFAEAPAAPLIDLMRGSRVLKEWLSPGSTGDRDLAAIVDALTAGGGRARRDSFYATQMSENLIKALKAGNLPGAALRLPGAVMEQVARPLMSGLVPRLKLAAAADLARFEISRLGPNAPREQMRSVMARAWDSVDNRFGQLVYDNLFMNKVAKDLTLTSFMSAGWQLGTVREIGGAITDTAAQTGRLLTGKRPEITPRMVYSAIALPVVTAMIGAMSQYLMTGQTPQELKDYFFPKTGRKDDQGNDERLTLPTYAKDVYGFYQKPGATAANKFNPIFGATAEMMSNRDFYGTEIRHADDPLVEQGKQLLTYFGTQMEPLGISNIRKVQKRGATTGQMVASVFGFSPAPASLTRTPAQALVAQFTQEKMPQGTRTRREFDRAQAMSDLSRRMRAGQDVSAEVEQAVKSGVIKTTDADEIARRAADTPFTGQFKRLNPEQAAKVFEASDEHERATLAPLLPMKVARIAPGDLTPELEKRLRALNAPQVTQILNARKPLESELQRLKMKLPAAGNKLTIESEQTELSSEQQADYERGLTERLAASLPELFNHPKYKKLTPERQRAAIQSYEKTIRSVETARMKAVVSSDRDLKSDAQDAEREFNLDRRYAVQDVIDEAQDKEIKPVRRKLVVPIPSPKDAGASNGRAGVQ